MIEHNVLCDLPTMNNKGIGQLYKAMGLWLDGSDMNAAKVLGVPDF